MGGSFLGVGQIISEIKIILFSLFFIFCASYA